jgi:hypothetical protein
MTCHAPYRNRTLDTCAVITECYSLCMSSRCRNCKDGLAIRFGASGRVVSFCHCPTGQRCAHPKTEEQLRAELLAAYAQIVGAS